MTQALLYLQASHDSGSSLPPRPSSNGRVSLAIDEGERISVDPAPPGTSRLNEIIIRAEDCVVSYGSWRRRRSNPSEEEEGFHSESD